MAIINLKVCPKTPKTNHKKLHLKDNTFQTKLFLTPLNFSLIYIWITSSANLRISKIKGPRNHKTLQNKEPISHHSPSYLFNINYPNLINHIFLKFIMFKYLKLKFSNAKVCYLTKASYLGYRTPHKASGVTLNQQVYK